MDIKLIPINSIVLYTMYQSNHKVRVNMIWDMDSQILDNIMSPIHHNFQELNIVHRMSTLTTSDIVYLLTKATQSTLKMSPIL